MNSVNLKIPLDPPFQKWEALLPPLYIVPYGNEGKKRRGTLWGERFKNVTVENGVELFECPISPISSISVSGTATR